MAITTGGFISVASFLLRPIFDKNVIFVFEFWNFKESVILDIAMLLLGNYVMCLMPLTILYGYDTIYLALCYEIVIQLRLLKSKLRNLSGDSFADLHKEVIDCVKHHQFLLK